jgi:Tfp pilus assembly pilus retraction ATPase PilT
MSDYKKMLEDLIDTIIRENGSDLHFAVGRYPSIRVTGELIPLVKQSVLTQEDVLGMLEIFARRQRKVRKIFEKSRNRFFLYIQS